MSLNLASGLNTRKRLSPLKIALGLSAVLAAVVFYTVVKGYSVPKALELPASTLTGSGRPLPAGRVVGPGRVEPRSGEIDLTPDMSGTIASLSVKEGDPIRKGQVLAELANKDLATKVISAEAALRVKTAAFDKMKNGARPEERQQASASLREQEVATSLAEKKLERQKKLFTGGFATPDAMDEARTQVETTRARQAAAKQNLALVEAGPRAEDLAVARGELDLARAQLEEAQATLDKTRIRAPVDGTVLRLYKYAGESVAAQPVLQVGDTGRLVVRVQVDESDIALVRNGAHADIVAPAYPGRTFGGEVTQISPRLGTKTIVTGQPTEKHDSRVLDVFVTLDADVALPVGLRVDAYIDTKAKDNGS